MWRTISFVERVEVEYSGNIFNQAILLGDLDNDKANELAVGNIDGTLFIFKGRERTPWRKCTNLGMITCIGIGDLFNKGKNNLYCLTAEGLFYVFDIKADSSETEEPEDEDKEKLIKPLFQQNLPPNGKVMLTADVDGDGKIELAVGYSDRMIRLYKWQPATMTPTPPASGTDSEPKGSFIQFDKWQLAGQIGTITINKDPSGKPQLLASQPGGTYVTLILRQDAQPSEPATPDSSGGDSVTETILYDPLITSRARNSSISTEIVGNIHKGPGVVSENGSDVLYALCTLDGTLVLVENGRILWSLQVDHQLFSLAKLDVTGNGKDEVVCCSWDGQTYIVNLGREAVRYQFEDNVTAFTAGYYAVDGKDNSPCFVYATFNNRIYIYYNISLPQVESTNLIEVMDKFEETHELLAKLNIHSPSNKQLQELYHWVLYGWHNKS